MKLKTGMRVQHGMWGGGVVMLISSCGWKRALVRFDRMGERGVWVEELEEEEKR